MKPVGVAVVACVGLLVAGAASAFDIAQPVPGATVQAGSTLHMEVVPAPGEVVEQLLVTTLDQATEAAPGALTVEVPVPVEAVGPLFVVVLATLEDGSNELEFVAVEVDPGPLDQLVAVVPPVLGIVGQVAPVTVTGIFADGVPRDLTLPDAGTTYQSSDADIVGVHPSGLVQARSRGEAQLLVESRGKAKVVTVRVDVPAIPENGIPVADAGPDQETTSETIVDLDASGSSDPDGDALTFEWEQVVGPFLILRDSDTAAAYFLAPRVSEPLVLEFEVVVSDGRGARTFPERVRVTVMP